ncbi:hypothetical protein IT895_01160 [Halomonas sp. A40-4]|uniref:hypothetical protein n=1 Tax=Halomonas sp. A40-4 TaxID=2785909 RepID=UPI0018EF777E|nr:hypothetical protein [Halomonas sp. A40-4]QPL46470.1 hypothetical protein IT895_01160 [Halomonas sp. A40-4]
MSHIQNHAENLQDMMGAIYGLADMLEKAGSGDTSEDEALMLSRFQRGCMVTAIKHLAGHADSLTDVIQEQEARKLTGAGGES